MSKSTKLSNDSSLPQPTRQRSEIVACEPFAPLSVFAETGEYRRFVQVCEATRRYRYISVCVGASGVGKTTAAHRYAQWDLFKPLLSAQGMVVPPSFAADCPIPRTAFYTVRPTATPKSIEQDLILLQWGMQMIADAARSRSEEIQPRSAAVRPDSVDLLVVDEVDRCSHISLEVLRDLFDRYPVGLVLLSRTDRIRHLLNHHPVAERAGVLHEFCALGDSDARLFITQQVHSLGLSLEEQALEAFIQKTRGNFRKIYLLLAHLDYMVARHGPFTVTVNELEEAVARLLTEKSVQALRGRNR
jgi:DNA transposition AAA+ family ATPase